MSYEQQPNGGVDSGADGDDPRGSPGSDDAFARGGVAGTSGADARESGPITPDVGPTAEAFQEQRDKYLRLAAEYDNYRKRAARERQDAGARAQADLVKQVIDALDDLSRFAHVDPSATDVATIAQGVDLVERKLLKAFGNAGLQVINPLDQPFDPSLHEAVATEPALSREDDHLVARVYQPGYLFNGQLLRPARVVVRQWNG
jgi:molecular chaperone GrpE